MKIRNFKLRAEYKDQARFFERAKEIFGTPVGIGGNIGGSSLFRWSLRDIYGLVDLSIRHDGTDTPWFEITSNFTDEAVDINAPPRPDDGGAFGVLWDRFVRAVSKPWEDWTEDEIMSSVVWCRQFVEDGNRPTDRIHTMMVMMSFEIPEDLDLRGYFQAWERNSQNPRLTV